MNASRVVFRPFTSEDWFGLAGATSWGEGMPPLLGEIKVDGVDAIAVLDAEGLSIIVVNEEGGEVADVYCHDLHIVARLVALLPAVTTLVELEASGFSRPSFSPSGATPATFED